MQGTSLKRQGGLRLLKPLHADIRPTGGTSVPETMRVGPLRVASHKIPCSDCRMREKCLPAGLTGAELELVDNSMVTDLRRVGRGETLLRAGDRFDALYAVWTGFFKTVITSRQGLQQVMGFQMCGDLIGLGGIDTGRHEIDAIALEDSQVCTIPYGALETLGRQVPSLQKHLNRFMSREIAIDHGLMLRLGSTHAEERVAAFLLDLVHRMRSRGFSASSVLLRMSREEIGSFLGLTLETVSRTFSKFQASGLLFVRQRQIRITDPFGLEQLLEATS